ncbi:MAG: tetratricopeptide repeat protein, partial [Myxococcota bacterium]|nr:tetratricopeptide repeat protein [Myxococcota bacterium]
TVGLGGCVTLGRHEELETRVAALERDRASLRADLERGFTQLENLNGLLKESEETLRRSGANLGIRMEQVESELPHIRGQIEAATFQVQSARDEINLVKREVFDRLGATALYLPADLPNSADEVWELTKREQAAENLRTVRALYDYFEASYPKDPRADDALMALGQLAEQEGDTTRAIGHYKRIHKEYADGDKAQEALWKIGSLLISRGDCERAVGIYRYISRNAENEEDKLTAEEKATEAETGEPCP